MSDWKPIESAPHRVPVKVWASLDPSDPLMSWREFVAYAKYGNDYWYTLGHRALRVWPTHWMPLASPPQEPANGPSS